MPARWLAAYLTSSVERYVTDTDGLPEAGGREWTDRPAVGLARRADKRLWPSAKRVSVAQKFVSPA